MDEEPDGAGGRLTLRLYGDLAELTGASDVQVPVGEPRSVKDAVESVGVPHTEVGLLRVDGRSVGFAASVTTGARVDVYPDPVELLPDDAVPLRPPPSSPPRFVADVHLGTLARRLRTLGFDTWWSNEADDVTLARIAVGDERILLTRDRGLLMRREIVHGHLPRSAAPDVQLREVVTRFDLDRHASPLTRCIRCNGELDPVDKAEVLDALPPATRREHDTFVRCTDCRQVYWPGSHLPGLEAVIRSL